MSPGTTNRPPLLHRSGAAGGADGTPGQCPYLGAQADAGSAPGFPSDANHCFRSPLPIPISSIHQENYCFSSQYEACPVYRQFATPEERAGVVPLAAVAAGAPEPAWAGESAGSAVAPATAVAASMALGAGRAPRAAPLEEPVHPDFEAATPVRRRGGIEPRAVVLSLVLLAVLLLAGWAMMNTIGQRSRAGSPGAVVTLPTLAPTVDMSVGQTAGAVAVGAAAEATATALGATAATPAAATAEAEAEATEASAVDSVAATATALFAGAVATTECRAPDWWVAYVAQEGDTVAALAAAHGILPEELIVANCLTAPEVTAGQALRLPPVGVIVLLPEATGTTAATATAGASQPVPTFPPVVVTRPPIIFLTPAFPVIVPPTPAPLVPEPPDPTSPAPPAPRPTSVPPTAPVTVPPTATPPVFSPTATPPTFGPTSTPPGLGPTATPPVFGTVQPTKTPPGMDGGSPSP